MRGEEKATNDKGLLVSHAEPPLAARNAYHPQESVAATLQRSLKGRSGSQGTVTTPELDRRPCARRGCQNSFRPRRGGKPQRFCSPHCRWLEWDAAYPRVYARQPRRGRSA